MKDYVSGGKVSEEAEHDNLVLLTSTTNPTTFEEAVHSSNGELQWTWSERNEIWELTDLPKGMKKIGVMCIFKTKLNENDEVDKYKASLVAKGYAQQHDIDYTEVFAPVASWDFI